MQFCSSCGGVVGRDCFNTYEYAQILAAMNTQYQIEMAVSQELQNIEKLRYENDQLRQELIETRKHLKTFASFVATCERNSTQEWMRMCLDWLNGVCNRISPDAYFVLDGKSFSIVNKGDGIERE